MADLFHPKLLTGHYKSIFETKYLNPILKNQSVEVIVIKKDTPGGKEFLRILHTLTGLAKQENQEFQIRNLLCHAWLILMREISAQRLHDPVPALYAHERIKNILSFIQKHYAEKITLTDLASNAGISEKECIRSFKNTFRKTPVDYLIEYRIEQAKHLLKETDEPVTNIAFMTGFHNSAYFSKTFKKYTQTTPRQYRQSP